MSKIVFFSMIDGNVTIDIDIVNMEYQSSILYVADKTSVYKIDEKGFLFKRGIFGSTYEKMGECASFILSD